MKKLIPLATLILSAFSSVASAQPLMNYTYLDVAYQWIYTDNDQIDNANGLDTEFSISPVKHFALEGGYSYAAARASVPFLGSSVNFDIDSHLFNYGGAGWYSLADGLDIVGHVGGIYAHSKVEDSFSNSSDSSNDNGVYAGATLRYLVAEDLETDLNVFYSHVDDSNWSYSLTGLYAVHENVALKADAAINNDSDVGLLGGVRLAM